ncbi:MAG TPA: rhamnulokinase family protein [Lacipirellulaceae bacterium]|nr:rhamnulokinase family protein [Lacipirellulaceae bacterium]
MTGMSKGYIAIDLGAESGRVIVGVLADGRLRLEEVHRFNHEPVWLPTGLHWDITGIWREIVAGLRRAAAWTKTNGVEPVSVGVDTWGVDWGIVDEAGELVGLPHAYRDPRNTAAYEEVLAKLGRDRIYQTTGIQFMALNTLYSLYAHKLADPDAVANGQLLFMPDLFHFWLSGQRTIEATIASTSQMVDCRTGDWAKEMLAELGLSTPALSPTTAPGSDIGPLRKALAEDTGLPAGMRVVAPASHDTASAVAAVPGEPASAGGINWCYLSSGTWSLLGAEINAPCVTAAAQAASFTNERGVANTFRFLKNIPGLWLVQECRREFTRQGQELDYAKLTQLAEGAAAFRTIIDPAHVAFQSPGNMPHKITEYARASGQPAPESPGQFVRSCLESLALAYREKLEMLERILGSRFDVIHVVGGGGKNTLLSQMAADATGRRVVVGPYEATASGNALVQGLAAREVGSLADLRRIVARSFEPAQYTPAANDRWHEAYERYKNLSAA